MYVLRTPYCALPHPKPLAAISVAMCRYALPESAALWTESRARRSARVRPASPLCGWLRISVTLTCSPICRSPLARRRMRRAARSSRDTRHRAWHIPPRRLVPGAAARTSAPPQSPRRADRSAQDRRSALRLRARNDGASEHGGSTPVSVCWTCRPRRTCCTEKNELGTAPDRV